jgi:AP2 domain.
VKGREFRTVAKGITRIDDPGRHGVGWYARVTFRGKTSSKYFADSTHGGTEAAFGKALAWRNAREKELGKPRTDRLVPATSSRSRTGIPGVYRTKNSYVVAWSPKPGELRREFVSITRYGPEEAFRRAVELRRRRERALYGRPISSLEQVRPSFRARSRKTTAAVKRRRRWGAAR